MGKTKASQPPRPPQDIDLPEGWAICPLGDVVMSAKGKKPRLLSPDNRTGQVPYIDIRAFESRKYREFTTRESAKVAPKGALLMVWDGARSGLVGRMPCEGAVGSTLAVLQPLLLDANYIYRFLQHNFDFINSSTRGTGIPHVDPGILWSISLPVAPVAEQRRIVAKVDELLEQTNAAQARLANLPTILKRFRRCILAAACSGQLTAEWRGANPTVEPAKTLLSRIKAARSEAAESARERRQIEEAFSDAQLSASQDEIAISDLPESWLICRVGAVGTVLNGSTPSRQNPDYWEGDIAWVSSGEVRNNIITDTRERITASGYANASVRLLPAGTVLLAMIGEGKTRGQTAILRIEATINQNIAAILLTHGLLLPEYMWRWFQFQYEATRIQGGGSGPQALNSQTVRELPFVLPPLEEQHEIVRRVEALFALAEGIEQHVRAASVRANRLPQAILARAFRGELVPTEAELAAKEGNDYESATALLERIQDERKKQELAKRGRGGKYMAKRKGRRPAKSRRPLDEVLREQSKPLTPERLFDLAGFDKDSVDGFYEQLRKLIQEGKVRENRPNRKEVTLQAVGK